MKTLFEAAVYEEICRRIGALRVEQRPLWGKMNVSQMLAHCSHAMDMASGITQFRQGILGKLIAPFLKSVYYNDKPFGKNNPTYKDFVIVDLREFAAERQALLERIDYFYEQGAEGCTRGPHPMFGYYSPEQWASGMYKHLDHHLRQFGV